MRVFLHADMRPVVIASVTRPAAAGRYRGAAVYAALLSAIGVLRHQSMAAAEIQLRRTKDCAVAVCAGWLNQPRPGALDRARLTQRKAGELSCARRSSTPVTLRESPFRRSIQAHKRKKPRLVRHPRAGFVAESSDRPSAERHFAWHASNCGANHTALFLYVKGYLHGTP